MTFKKKCQQDIRAAHHNYVNNIVTEGLPSDNKRPFWKYITVFGIPAMKQGSILYTDSQSKANILLYEFKSVFTKSSIHQLNGTKYKEALPLTIHTDGIRKLLKNLKPKKASGPNNILTN
jgi:hypothetical protein